MHMKSIIEKTYFVQSGYKFPVDIALFSALLIGLIKCKDDKVSLKRIDNLKTKPYLLRNAVMEIINPAMCSLEPEINNRSGLQALRVVETSVCSEQGQCDNLQLQGVC